MKEAIEINLKIFNLMSQIRERLQFWPFSTNLDLKLNAKEKMSGDVMSQREKMVNALLW